MWCHGPAWPFYSSCQRDSLLTQHPPFHRRDLTWRRQGKRMCLFREGWCPRASVWSVAPTPGAPGALRAAALFQVRYVREGESTNKRKLNMESEFVCLPRSLGVAEWNCINTNSDYRTLDTCRSTCTIGPSQNSGGSWKEKTETCIGSHWLQKKSIASLDMSIFKCLIFLFLMLLSFISFTVLHL